MNLPTRLLLLALVSPLLAAAATVPPAPSRPVSELALAQAERVAVDLRQGMSAEDVRALLGKPRRTALRNGGLSTRTSDQGTLQWTYVWGGPAGQGSLHIEFAAKTPEAWTVASWEWSAY